MNELELNIPGLTIAGRMWGNPNNPPILALHGWLDNANSFNPLAEYLQNKYCFIAIDLPGHGKSSHLPEGSHYHFIDGVSTVIQIIEALNLEKVHLMGHSLGACLASIVAGVSPAHVRSLSLIEGLGPLTHPPATTCKQLSHYITQKIHGKTKRPKGYSSFENAAHARSVKGYVSLEIAHILCERGVLKKNGMYYWRHDRRLVEPTPLKMTEEQVLSCLKEIQAPTYLFWASNGFSFNFRTIDKRVREVKDIAIKQLEGGHHVHMEQPEEIATILTAFYQAL